jgi:four helix bundle protein
MDRVELEKRTKQFALSIIGYVATLPKSNISKVLGNQLLKSGTSVGANYREANRAQSKKDFMHKISIVEKEASESHYWLELFHETETGNAQKRTRLLKESKELTAIFTAIGRTCKTQKSRGL